jgi:hypothetical protein
MSKTEGDGSGCTVVEGIEVHTKLNEPGGVKLRFNGGGNEVLVHRHIQNVANLFASRRRGAVADGRSVVWQGVKSEHERT